MLGEARRRFVLLGEGVAGLSEGFAQRVAAFSSSGAVPRGVGAAPIFFYIASRAAFWCLGSMHIAPHALLT
ncbi:hypothetical protein B7486_16385 [cyanobacterium TDX16]|nr:hypothetical protein B7486_16385 [cyanobacterium TDX16]